MPHTPVSQCLKCLTVSVSLPISPLVLGVLYRTLVWSVSSSPLVPGTPLDLPEQVPREG